MRVVILGSPGAGKSTMAQGLAQAHGLAVLELDLIAWYPDTADRRPVAECRPQIEAFLAAHRGWVIEGCQGDLAALALPHATEFILLNPGPDLCLQRLAERGMDAAQFQNERQKADAWAGLVETLRSYAHRADDQALPHHRAIFNAFPGPKCELHWRDGQWVETRDADQL